MVTTLAPPALTSLPPEEDLRPLADRAYERLREAIVEGILIPGAKLSERGLAAALGISAQPVREALRRLEAEGMVETRPRSGSFVAPLDTPRLVEMGRIRAALEGAAAGLAARRAGAADIAVLRSRLAAMRAATGTGDPAMLRRANEAFHDALHTIGGNAFLIRSLHALGAYDHIGRARALAAEDEPRQALDEHAAILDAIAARDAEAAEALMRAHTLRSLAVAFPEESRD
ncbi:GntR family transcriptional regulator [Roseomonas marmotae]|uniref:GntR family transcriptional regulator n=1 Tax=Roseomonas marmotae TaxID=2768161 RepID=A0ABS3KEP1_9PROT|nr:GntR family transcriptional regulator [Roseomonas marmotae]MBO1075900.1 GntR family transcriptional regulator [Roseomonas marmotae]QTI81917.1 GntR family transcriptional regulator [Roseomonas marmotae]